MLLWIWVIFHICGELRGPVSLAGFTTWQAETLEESMVGVCSAGLKESSRGRGHAGPWCVCSPSHRAPLWSPPVALQLRPHPELTLGENWFEPLFVPLHVPPRVSHRGCEKASVFLCGLPWTFFVLRESWDPESLRCSRGRCVLKAVGKASAGS